MPLLLSDVDPSTCILFSASVRRLSVGHTAAMAFQWCFHVNESVALVRENYCRPISGEGHHLLHDDGSVRVEWKREWEWQAGWTKHT